MRIEQTFHVARPPEEVFDYVTTPSNLQAWQTSKTRVEVLTDGPPRLGYRVREWTKPPGAKEFEQVVEFTDFDRPERRSRPLTTPGFSQTRTGTASSR